MVQVLVGGCLVDGPGVGRRLSSGWSRCW